MSFHITATKTYQLNDVETHTTKIEIYTKSRKIKKTITEQLKEKGYEVKSKFISKIPARVESREFVLVLGKE